GRTLSGPAANSAPVAAAPIPTGPARISPKARRLAKELGVDVSALRGSGPDGEIVADDVQKAATSVIAATTASPAPATSTTFTAVRATPATVSTSSTESLSSIGRLMAERTTRSWTTVPHFFVTRDVDGGSMVALRDKLESSIENSRGVKLTYTDL